MSRAQGNLLAQINRISGTQEMGWRRICLLESALTPFMPEAVVSLTKLSRWFICIFYVFLVLISSCSSDLELGGNSEFPESASMVLDKSFISLCFNVSL